MIANHFDANIRSSGFRLPHHHLTTCRQDRWVPDSLTSYQSRHDRNAIVLGENRRITNVFLMQMGTDDQHRRNIGGDPRLNRCSEASWPWIDNHVTPTQPSKTFAKHSGGDQEFVIADEADHQTPIKKSVGTSSRTPRPPPVRYGYSNLPYQHPRKKREKPPPVHQPKT